MIASLPFTPTSNAAPNAGCPPAEAGGDGPTRSFRDQFRDCLAADGAQKQPEATGQSPAPLPRPIPDAQLPPETRDANVMPSSPTLSSFSPICAMDQPTTSREVSAPPLASDDVLALPPVTDSMTVVPTETVLTDQPIAKTGGPGAVTAETCAPAPDLEATAEQPDANAQIGMSTPALLAKAPDPVIATSAPPGASTVVDGAMHDAGTQRDRAVAPGTPIVPSDQPKAALPTMRPAIEQSAAPDLGTAFDNAAPPPTSSPSGLADPAHRSGTVPSAPQQAAPVVMTHRADWPQTVVSATLASLTSGGGTMTLELAPETLGALRITLTLDGDSASVRIQTETPEAARVLNDAERQIAQDFARQGITLSAHDAQSDRRREPGQSGSDPSEPVSNDTPVSDPDAQLLSHGTINLIA